MVVIPGLCSQNVNVPTVSRLCLSLSLSLSQGRARVGLHTAKGPRSGADDCFCAVENLTQHKHESNQAWKSWIGRQMLPRWEGEGGACGCPFRRRPEEERFYCWGQCRNIEKSSAAHRQENQTSSDLLRVPPDVMSSLSLGCKSPLRDTPPQEHGCK